MPSGFLAGKELIPWSSDDTDFDVDGVAIGEGRQALEIVVARSSSRPTKDELDRLWRERWDQRANPVLAVALYGSNARILGPDEDGAIDEIGIDPDQLERICQAALEEPNRHAARRFLKEALAEAGDGHAGLRNQGLLSTHELMTGVPRRDDWDTAKDNGRRLLGKQGKELVEGLGYELEPLTGHGYVLKDQGRESAVAVFLEEGEAFDRSQERFTGDSPVAYGLNKAEQKNVDKVIVNSGGILRLFTTDPEDGFGSRGRTDTFVEVNTNILDEDDAGYVWLLFSAPALRDEGTLEEIMELSEEYAADLGARLRERIYDDVVPDLAQALAQARELEDPTREELDETYEMALFLLYRLLFIAYGEDERFLPRNQNPRYDPRSLKQKARELHEILDSDIEFDERSTTHWDDVMALTEAIHNGHREWGLPEYDGTLLTSDPDISPAGGRLAEVELTDDEFGPILQNLLIDETEEGYQGPVDFRNIGVREFGVIYEGLLESELSVAGTDLTVEIRDDEEVYAPAHEDDHVEVAEGEVYLHGLSGERKSTGTYYTKTRFVEHLLDHSLDPALDEHLAELDEMTDREAEEAFFDFSVADIAMGSGHFLVAAVDHIESKFSQYLHERNLPGIQDELDRLKETAEAAFEDTEAAPEIERDQLLRRQIARRCVYGVDINPLATELARLSLWVHTFVPGLPLTFLDYNLVSGDSLAGIGTVDEVTDILDLDQQRLDFFVGGADTMEQIEEDIAQLGQLADADASEVKEARQTRARIEDDLQQTRAAFDILAASRVDEDVNANVVQDDLDELTDTDAYEQASLVLSETDPLHFPVAFPNVFREPDPGFDVIIGNPPWEEITLEEDEFWMRYVPGLQGMTQTEQERTKEQMREERPDLVERYERELEQQDNLREILRNGPYPGIGTGDPDTYKAFYWRFWNLTPQKGSVGVVLPRTAFIAAGSEEFRRTVLDEAEVRDLTFLKNKAGWVFPDAEHRYTIALFAFHKGTAGGRLNLRGPFPDSDSFEAGVERDPASFSTEEAKTWTGKAGFPLLPADPRSVDVFNRMAEAPRLDLDEPGNWRARPNTELHATNDKKKNDGTILMHFTEDPPDDFWPIYKGASFDLWEPDTGVRYAWADPEVMLGHLQDSRENSYQYAGSRSAYSEMPEDWVQNPETLECLRPRIAFRDVSRRTDSRTVRACLVPPEVFLTNKAPYLLWPRGDERDQAFLLGVLCSIPFDWYARRFVETSLNYHIFNALRVPRPDRNHPLWERVVELAGELAAVDDRFEDWSAEVGVQSGRPPGDQKEQLVSELDAAVCHLYGLNREHIEVVFQTFHEGWNRHVTDDRLKAVLDHYDAWEARLHE